MEAIYFVVGSVVLGGLLLSYFVCSWIDHITKPTEEDYYDEIDSVWSNDPHED